MVTGELNADITAPSFHIAQILNRIAAQAYKANEASETVISQLKRLEQWASPSSGQGLLVS
jgi:hypothetical protein